jgi:GntR family transcriptional regulator, carbon starvation induced regulator
MVKRALNRDIKVVLPVEEIAEQTRDAPTEAAKTLGEEVYRLLRRDILSGRLSPGSKLPFRQLAQHYSVGIAPLREALSKLASERLVSFEGQRGFTVAPVSRGELHDLCTLWSELSVASLKMAIERGDANWEAEILAALHRLRRTSLPASPSDYQAIENWERLHAQFHTSLIAACGAPWRLHFCSVLSDQFERYRRVSLLKIATSAPAAQKVDEEHRQIAEATVDRDSDRAAQLLADHFAGSLSYVAAQYESLAPQTSS